MSSGLTGQRTLQPEHSAWAIQLCSKIIAKERKSERLEKWHHKLVQYPMWGYQHANKMMACHPNIVQSAADKQATLSIDNSACSACSWWKVRDTDKWNSPQVYQIDQADLNSSIHPWTVTPLVFMLAFNFLIARHLLMNQEMKHISYLRNWFCNYWLKAGFKAALNLTDQ